MSTFSHTQSEYDNWGEEITNDNLENWTDVDRFPYDDVSLVARIVYAEDTYPETHLGRAAVAQELHNRMRSWRFIAFFPG